jgi:CubicO group peptidase (beta-lactamase class C family)
MVGTSIAPEATRRGLIGLAVGLAGVAAVGRAAAVPTSGDWSALDALLAKSVSSGGTPGIAFAVHKKGEVIYAKGFGYANLETETKTTPENIFRIGSITKQFTASAILLLAEEGKLSIDDKLSRFYPDFPGAANITLRQMLSHTSGMANYTMVPRLAPDGPAGRLDYDDKALLAAMQESKPMYLFKPGEGWAYSNTAFVILGLVIGKVTGEPYPAFFKRRLFGPAGLSVTAVDDAAEVVPHRASGYHPDAHAASGFVNAAYIGMTFPGAAGNLRSSVNDLCRWHEALFGGKILKPSSLEQMTTAVKLNNGTYFEMTGPETGKKTPVHYGFGLQLGETDGRKFASHGGGINGFISTVQTYLDDRISIAGLVNTDNPGKDASFKPICDQALRIALKA